MGRRRYILSIIIFFITASTLVFGGALNMMDTASARDYRRGQNNYYSNSNRNDRDRGSQSQQRQQSEKPQTTTTTPKTPSRQSPSAPVTPAPSAPDQTPQIVSRPVVVEPTPEPTPVDTAQAIVAMTEAQADDDVAPVNYTTSRISDDMRNRLVILAGIAALGGAVLFTMSLIGGATASQKQAIPVRYIVPVREVVTN